MTGRLAVRAGAYVVFYLATLFLVTPLLLWAWGFLAGVTLAGFMAALIANTLAVRFYEEGVALPDLGLRWGAASRSNLLLGLVGGAGSAALVLGPPLLTGWATLKPDTQPTADIWQAMFVPAMLLLGAAGEEIVFRGYGFQILIRGLGPWQTILPAGVLFALLHAGNPNATPLGLVNTAAFGVVFGYAFLRSRDLWLPIGLHYGWNVTLPLFGVNVSGLKIGLTGRVMEWSAGELWSGGAYGPEGSLLATGVLAALTLYLWKAPIRRQTALLLDSPRELPCDTPPPSSPPPPPPPRPIT